MRFSIFRNALVVCATLLFGTMSSEEGIASDDTDLDAFVTHIETLSCTEATAFIENRRPSAGTEVSSVRQHARAVLEVYLLLSRCALNTPPPEALREGQLRGMVAALGDPHAQYLNKKDYRAMNESLQGSYSGIGIDIPDDIAALQQGSLTVTRVFPGTPAEKAGIVVGDIILDVDGYLVSRFKNRAEAIEKIRGEHGKPVRLRMRTKNGELVSRTVVPGVIKVENVTYTVLPSKWAYIRVRSISGEPATDMRGNPTLSMCNDIVQAYMGAVRTAGPLEGMVLDLRNNNGGLVSGSGCAINLFAPSHMTGQPFLSVRNREGLKDYALAVRSFDLLQGKPLLVLVDAGTASAAEILAKWIQCNKRGVIAGVPTYGKGSVQVSQALYGGKTGIKYTISEYFVNCADGTVAPVQGVGVTPDIRVRSTRIADPEALEIVRERDTLGFIPGTSEVKDTLPQNIAADQPGLYQRIMEVLAAEPFWLIHDK